MHDYLFTLIFSCYFLSNAENITQNTDKEKKAILYMENCCSLSGTVFSIKRYKYSNLELQVEILLC